MQRRVDYLLCSPYLWGHRGDFSLLVGGDKFLCILEAGRGDEEGSREEQQLVLTQNLRRTTVYLPHHGLVGRPEHVLT